MINYDTFFIFLLIFSFIIRYISSVKDFRSGKSPILVATDVAARGLGKYRVSFCYTMLYMLCYKIYSCSLHLYKHTQTNIYTLNQLFTFVNH